MTECCEQYFCNIANVAIKWNLQQSSTINPQTKHYSAFFTFKKTNKQGSPVHIINLPNQKLTQLITNTHIFWSDFN